MIPVDDRVELMVRAHGEVCTKAYAARLLNCAPATIGQMIQDGRLDPACEGKRVDVRSIARFIARPEEEKMKARLRRVKMRYKSEFAV